MAAVLAVSVDLQTSRSLESSASRNVAESLCAQQFFGLLNPVAVSSRHLNDEADHAVMMEEDELQGTRCGIGGPRGIVELG